MKLFDIKWNTYIGSSKETNNEDSKFKIGDIVRISKYKKFFEKSFEAMIEIEQIFVIKKLCD